MPFGSSKRRDGKIGGISVHDVVGQLFNAPNTAVGMTYGALGQATGEIAHAMNPRVPQPRMVTRGGRTEFLNNPFAGAGAITIGEVTTYGDDPYSPEGRKNWRETERREGHPVWEHERQHVLQGRQLGPLYLPSNIAGGLTALAHFRDRPDDPWHGPRNWNERGPSINPPRPWSGSKLK